MYKLSIKPNRTAIRRIGKNDGLGGNRLYYRILAMADWICRDAGMTREDENVYTISSDDNYMRALLLVIAGFKRNHIFYFFEEFLWDEDGDVGDLIDSSLDIEEKTRKNKKKKFNRERFMEKDRNLCTLCDVLGLREDKSQRRIG